MPEIFFCADIQIFWGLNSYNNTYNCGNYHGFSDAILTNKTGSQMVYVYAVNVGAGSTNPFIGKCSLSIPNSSASNIKGYSDIICGEENAVFVEGWAFDKNDISKTITIDVYIGGQPGDVGAEMHKITADKLRADVNNAYQCGKYHGFLEAIYTDKIGIQPVYIYAVNLGEGNANPCICKCSVGIYDELVMSKVSKKGYQILLDTSRYSGVSKVKFATWLSGKENDITYTDAVIEGNIAYAYINTNKHTSSSDVYNTYAYAYDSSGKLIQLYDYQDKPEDLGIRFPVLSQDYWLKKTIDYNGHKYYLILADMSWTEAQEWCKNHNGYLATVTSKKEWEKIKNLLAENNASCCWLGAENTSGSWKWVTGEKFSYTDWYTGQPDCANGNEFYLGTYEGSRMYSYLWNDFTDKSDLVGCFICEQPYQYDVSYHFTIDNVSYKYNQKKTYGEDMPVWADVPSKSHYEFAGWSTDQNSQTVKYKPGDKYTDNKNIDLYGVWNIRHEYKTSVIAPTVSEEGYTLHECTICGYSYKDDYKDKLLVNTSALAEDNVKVGSYITINASAIGGTGDYKYAVYYKRATSSEWTTKQKYSTNAEISIKTAAAVNYDIIVKVRDGHGTISEKAFSVNVFAGLKNTSAVASEKIVLGDVITVNASATGGLGDYQYEVYYRQESSSKWTKKQSYSANSKISFKPKKAVVYDVSVKVKDSRNAVVKKYFKVSVTVPENTSSVASDEINLGDTIDILCSATGGSGKYQYAVYYRKTGAETWKTKQNYSSNNTVSIKPASRTSYEISVKAKDSLGNVSKKSFTVTVK